MNEGSDRNRRVLRHALSVAAILLLACVLFYKHFYTRGTLIHVDMTYPTTIERNIALYFNSWWQYGSVTNIWNLQRVFWSYPLLMFSRLLGLNVSQYLLVMYIGTFALAGISMYALSFSVIRSSRLGVNSRLARHAGAVLAAVVFMYNPWSLSHLWPYFGYPGYAVLPLVFLLLVKSVQSPRFLYILPLALVISIASTGPICVVWFWFLIATYLLFHVFVANRFSRESLLNAVKVLVPLAALYVLLSAAWMLPYAYSRLSGKPFAPSYLPEMSERMLDLFSETSSVMNNMRLASGWGMPVNPEVSGAYWTLLSFALPVISIIALAVLYRKIRSNGAVIYWALMFAVVVLLATGTVFVLRRPYYYLILHGPGSSSFGWILRAFDRWLVYAPVFFALLVSLLAVHLLSSKKAAASGLAFVMVALVLVSFWPIGSAYARNVYNPTRIPGDYSRVNEYVAKAAAGARVAWMPFARSGFNFFWAPEKRIAPVNVISSNPNLNNMQDLFARDNFYFWLESLFSRTAAGPFAVMDNSRMLKDDIAARLFVPFSARYLVFDESVPGYRLKQSLQSDTSLEEVMKTVNLRLFEFDDFAAHLRPALRALRVDNHYDMLAVAQKLDMAQLDKITFIDRDPRSSMADRYGALDITDYKDAYDINGGFARVLPKGVPEGWTLEQPDLRVTLALEPGAGGQARLHISNGATQDFSDVHLVGREIAARAGDVYSFRTRMKFRNSKWTFANIEGYDERNEEWVTLVNCPQVARDHDSAWRTSTCSFYLPEGYTRIRPVLHGGWVADTGRGPADSWFEDVRLSRVSDRLYGDLFPAGGPEVTWKQESAQRFKVKVRGAAEPFVLVFGEAYDPLWLATTSAGKKIDPVRQYSVITGFPVEKGDTDLTIDYIPQKPFVVGLAVSVTALVVCLLCLAWIWFRKRRREARNDPM